MRFTTQDWTAIQTQLPADDGGDAARLWEKIEYRLGKARVSITLTKAESSLVQTAIEALLARHGFTVHDLTGGKAGRNR